MHLNSVLRAIRNVNRLIVREKDRDRLLQVACEELVVERGYLFTSVGLLGEGEKVDKLYQAGIVKEKQSCSLIKSNNEKTITDCSHGSYFIWSYTVKSLLLPSPLVSRNYFMLITH